MGRNSTFGLLALGVGALAVVVLGSPWLLMLAVLGSVFFAAEAATSRLSAIPVSLILALSGYACMLPVFGILPWSFANEVLVTEVVLGVTALLVTPLCRVRPSSNVHDKALLAASVTLPVTIGLSAVGWLQTLGRDRFAWAMNSDMVWNTLGGQFIIADGGVNQQIHTNPAPLSAGLMASATSVGRGVSNHQDLLRHDVTRQAELWIVLTVATGILAGLVVVAAGAPRNRRKTNLLLIVGATLLPLLPNVAGTIFHFGFFNASVAICLLFSLWVVWMDLAARPAMSCAFICLCAIALLACWAPLALVALLLASIRALQWVRLKRLTPSWRLGFVLLSISTVPAYLAIVTVPDFRRERGALAGNGNILTFPHEAFIILLAVLLICAFSANTDRARNAFIGVAGIIATGVLAILFLVSQSGGQLWAYYPAKMAWIIVVFGVVVALGSFAAHQHRTERTRGVQAIGIALLMLFFLTRQAPSIIVGGDRLFYGDRHSVSAVADVLRYAEKGRRTVAFRNLPREADDEFINLWLLQINSESGYDPIRNFAYDFDSRDVRDLCVLIAQWGRGVRVITTDPEVRTQLDSECAAFSDVELVIRIPVEA